MATKAEEFLSELKAQGQGFSKLSQEDQIRFMQRILQKHSGMAQVAFDGRGQRLIFKDGSAAENQYVRPYHWIALAPTAAFLREYKQ